MGNYNTSQFNSDITQQFFPRPQGSVFMINDSVEVEQIPLIPGISAIICMPEKMLYIRGIQGGQPFFYAYRIDSYMQEPQNQIATSKQGINSSNNLNDDVMAQCLEKITKLEQKITLLEKEKSKNENKKGGSKNELAI